PVTGEVFIKFPHGGSLYPAHDQHTHTTSLTKGQGYIPLTEPRTIPNGSLIDARAGTLTLVTATGAGKNSDRNGTFNGAIFGTNQAASGVHKGLTTLTLKEAAFPGAPSYSTCKKHAPDTGVAGELTPAARQLAAHTDAALRDPFATLAK